MSTHTPGPWKAVASGIQAPTCLVIGDDTIKADDARLIAAAPDLLAALLTIAKIASEGRESDIDIESIARRAIAKAEGTQSATTDRTSTNQRGV